MNSDRRPTLCVVAGPNGSGKTTTTIQLLANEWAAARLATEKRYECIEQRRDFVFETVFSSSEKLDFLRKAKDAGFFIRFFYVCTADPSINARRVYQRYLDGGHEVPISKIISRYYKSLENAAQAVEFVDRAYFYDNSVDNELPKLLFRTSDGKVAKQYIPILPDWAKALLP